MLLTGPVTCDTLSNSSSLSLGEDLNPDIPRDIKKSSPVQLVVTVNVANHIPLNVNKVIISVKKKILGGEGHIMVVFFSAYTYFHNLNLYRGR